jgi:hypothetical protein
MNKNLALFLSYVAAFTIGLYTSSQFKFNTPIEPYKWFITSFFWGMFSIISFIKNKRNNK